MRTLSLFALVIGAALLIFGGEASAQAVRHTVPGNGGVVPPNRLPPVFRPFPANQLAFQRALELQRLRLLRQQALFAQQAALYGQMIPLGGVGAAAALPYGMSFAPAATGAGCGVGAAALPYGAGLAPALAPMAYGLAPAGVGFAPAFAPAFNPLLNRGLIGRQFVPRARLGTGVVPLAFRLLFGF